MRPFKIDIKENEIKLSKEQKDSLKKMNVLNQKFRVHVLQGSYKIFKLSFSNNDNNRLLENYLNFCICCYSTFIKKFTLDLIVNTVLDEFNCFIGTELDKNNQGLLLKKITQKI